MVLEIEQDLDIKKGGSKMEKNYKLTKDDIKILIDSREGCIATDRITVDGMKVGYMYREEPSEKYPDSRMEISCWG